jgi:hypothetical protein
VQVITDNDPFNIWNLAGVLMGAFGYVGLVRTGSPPARDAAQSVWPGPPRILTRPPRVATAKISPVVPRGLLGFPREWLSRSFRMYHTIAIHPERVGLDLEVPYYVLLVLIHPNVT